MILKNYISVPDKVAGPVLLRPDLLPLCGSHLLAGAQHEVHLELHCILFNKTHTTKMRFGMDELSFLLIQRL